MLAGLLFFLAHLMLEPEGMTLRQVWVQPQDVGGAPSPDGRYFSFVDWDTGDLAVRNLDTGESRRVTSKGSWSQSDEFALYSVFSPDGGQIAYSWLNAEKKNIFDLRVIGIDGAHERVLYSNEEVSYLQPAAWLADGKQILARFSRRDGTNQIALVSVSDGSVRILKSLDWRGPGKMRSSLDGKYIVYDFAPGEDSANRDIFLLATDGSREVPLVEHPADDYVLGWAPDGQRILYASDRTGNWDAWVVHVAAGEPQGEPMLLKGNVGPIEPMGLTRDGSFYYVTATRLMDVYVAAVDPETGKLTEKPKPVTQRFVGRNREPAWSPDGLSLAYVSTRGQDSAVVCIRSLKTGEEREVVPRQKISVQRIRWSPDGASILARAYDRQRRSRVFRIDVKSGETHVLEENWDQVAGLSHDGKKTYSVRQGADGRAILVRDVTTHEEKELYRAPSSPRILNLSLSGDGQHLAFLERKSGTDDRLKVLRTGGGEARELLRLPQSEIFRQAGVGWTRDGRYLLFGRGRWGKVELWRIAAAGGKPEKLELRVPTPVIQRLTVHPDGRRIAFAAGYPQKGAIWVMKNFLPTLTSAR